MECKEYQKVMDILGKILDSNGILQETVLSGYCPKKDLGIYEGGI